MHQSPIVEGLAPKARHGLSFLLYSPNSRSIPPVSRGAGTDEVSCSTVLLTTEATLSGLLFVRNSR